MVAGDVAGASDKEAVEGSLGAFVDARSSDVSLDPFDTRGDGPLVVGGDVDAVPDVVPDVVGVTTAAGCDAD